MATLFLTEHLEVGVRGEDLAERAFLEMEFVICERNWRGGGGELDLVCTQGELVVFVEVRTRRSRFLQSPTMTINGPKQARLARAASAWLMGQAGSYPVIRFDVIAVLIEPDGVRLEHVENAFVPKWAY